MRVDSPYGCAENDATVGVTSTDAPGLCLVEWEVEGVATGITCDGYITGDGTLFVPSDGDGGHGAALNADGTLDQQCGGWYKASTGASAVWINGQPCVLE